MRKLTGREKVLIYIALIMGVCYIGYFFCLLPAKARCERAGESLLLAERTVAEYQSVDARIMTLTREVELEKQRYLENPSPYPGIMSPADLEQQVIQLLAGYGVRINSTQIEDYIPLGKESVSGSGESSPSSARIGRIEIEFIGDWEQIYAMFDGMKDKPEFYIASCQMSPVSDSASDYSVHAVIECSMLGVPELEEG